MNVIITVYIYNIVWHHANTF